jgi:hypothetical protein
LQQLYQGDGGRKNERPEISPSGRFRKKRTVVREEDGAGVDLENGLLLLPAQQHFGTLQEILSDILAETVAVAEELLEGGEHLVVLDLLTPRLSLLEDGVVLQVADLQHASKEGGIRIESGIRVLNVGEKTYANTADANTERDGGGDLVLGGHSITLLLRKQGIGAEKKIESGDMAQPMWGRNESAGDRFPFAKVNLCEFSC